MTQRPWSPILSLAADVVAEYPYRITLRQLHYRLAMTPGLGYRNTRSDYTQLSDRTAEGRRQGAFPALLDQTRAIHQPAHWANGREALEALARQYRCDRTAGQVANMGFGGGLYRRRRRGLTCSNPARERINDDERKRSDNGDHA